MVAEVIDLRVATPLVQEMSHHLQASESYVVVDIETTGFSPAKGARIIEIAALKYTKGKIESAFHQYVDPGIKIPKKIVELTGITDAMVSGKLTIVPVMKAFAQFLGDVPIIAHKKQFDWDRFLKPSLLQAGYAATNPSVCTVTLAKAYLGKMENYQLDTISAHFDITIEQHHAGWADVKALSEIILKFKEFEIYTTTSLFDTLEQKPLTTKENAVESFKIKRVSYWEKAVTKKQTMERIYVLLDVGTVFYDFATNCWTNKDVTKTLNFEEIEQRVLKFKNVNALIELKKITITA